MPTLFRTAKKYLLNAAWLRYNISVFQETNKVLKIEKPSGGTQNKIGSTQKSQAI